MFHSAETRWFFKGTVDDAVERWFRSGGLFSERGERQDEYILLPRCDSAGVKFREGNFEVKAATSTTRGFRVGDNLEGCRETWVKWSRPASAASSENPDMRDDEQWAFVRKRRLLRLFSLESATIEEVATGGAWLSAGCQVERTIVSVLLRRASDGPPVETEWANADPWWTVGFEAFGDPAEIDDQLERMLEHFVASAPGVRLPHAASMSYPAWLARLASGDSG